MAREAWQRAGVADRIELRIGPAVDTLRSLPEDFVVDLAFVDADKTNYPAYYEELLRRLRPNGVMLIDNTLWHGAVIDLSAGTTARERSGPSTTPWRPTIGSTPCCCRSATASR